MPNQKGNLTIIAGILVGLLILVVSFFHYSKFFQSTSPESQTGITPTPTVVNSPKPSEAAESDWSTYSNTAVGFTIGYPNKTKVPYVVKGTHEGQDVPVDGYEDNTVINFPGNSPNYENAFILDLLPYNGTLEDAPKDPTKRLTFISYNGQLLDKDFLIDNNPTLWYKHPSENNRFEIYLVKNNHLFVFQSGMEVSEYQMEQILSTLKFTK